MAGSIMLGSKPVRCIRHGNADILIRREEDQIMILGDHEVFVLKGAEARLWDSCDGNITCREMISALLDEFDVEESVAFQEGLSFLQALLNRKLILI